ncbi:trichohyalin, putative [Entamoeba histolytica]
MGITQSTPNNKSKDKTKEIIKQIEELTERRINNILFDSYYDNWNKNTSVFDQRLMNKENIIIIIEDSDGNKFGGYVNSKIDEVGHYIKDSHSFLFSLESKGRMKRMKKFDIIEQEYAFWLDNQSSDGLFSFGCGLIGNRCDIYVYKDNDKTLSFCKQNSFKYEGISKALCGKELFTTKRIIVIEMK